MGSVPLRVVEAISTCFVVVSFNYKNSKMNQKKKILMVESRKKEISSLWPHWEEGQRDPVTPQSRLHLQGPEVTLNRVKDVHI